MANSTYRRFYGKGGTILPLLIIIFLMLVTGVLLDTLLVPNMFKNENPLFLIIIVIAAPYVVALYFSIFVIIYGRGIIKKHHTLKHGDLVLGGPGTKDHFSLINANLGFLIFPSREVGFRYVDEYNNTFDVTQFISFTHNVDIDKFKEGTLPLRVCGYDAVIDEKALKQMVKGTFDYSSMNKIMEERTKELIEKQKTIMSHNFPYREYSLVENIKDEEDAKFVKEIFDRISSGGMVVVQPDEIKRLTVIRDKEKEMNERSFTDRYDERLMVDLAFVNYALCKDKDTALKVINILMPLADKNCLPAIKVLAAMIDPDSSKVKTLIKTNDFLALKLLIYAYFLQNTVDDKLFGRIAMKLDRPNSNTNYSQAILAYRILQGDKNPALVKKLIQYKNEDSEYVTDIRDALLLSFSNSDEKIREHFKKTDYCVGHYSNKYLELLKQLQCYKVLNSFLEAARIENETFLLKRNLK